MAARDSDDALTCCVENTVEDRIMDSGASFHATYCKEELERFKLRSSKVRLADYKTLDIVGVGDVVLKTSFSTSWTLKDVRNKRGSLYLDEVHPEGIGAIIVGSGSAALWFGEAEEYFLHNVSEDKETTEVEATGVVVDIMQTFRQEGNASFGIQDLCLNQELLEYMDVHDNDASESSQPSWGKIKDNEESKLEYKYSRPGEPIEDIFSSGKRFGDDIYVVSVPPIRCRSKTPISKNFKEPFDKSQTLQRTEGMTEGMKQNRNKSKSWKIGEIKYKHNITCWNCNQKSHFQNQCSKLVASRDKVVNMAAGDSDDALACCVENTVEDRIMDSGASFHATHSSWTLKDVSLARDVQFSTDRVVWHEPEQFSSELNNISLELYTVQKSVQRCVHVPYTLTKWYREPGYDKQWQKTELYTVQKSVQRCVQVPYTLTKWYREPGYDKQWQRTRTDTGAEGMTEGMKQNRNKSKSWKIGEIKYKHNITCWNCNQKGQFQNQCSKLVASRDKVVNMAAGDSYDALACCVENTVEDRIMDYGASFHATYCKEELERC
ncbi:hypothetical protein Tco_0682200 [Tanacetum coccineum]|uniref:CCHC-type domain-containing protein n=1 Tax=Tanacetum coccineum TaxID=301880 RepID=A0ABQ4XS12_9ASTR